MMELQVQKLNCQRCLLPSLVLQPSDRHPQPFPGPSHLNMNNDNREYKCVIGLGTDNNNTVRINQDNVIMSSEIVQLLTMFGEH